MSKVKLYSFTVGREAGWVAASPLGLIIAEPGVQVTVVVSETWEQGVAAVAAYQQQEKDEHK